jgi:hypothetical protein
MNNPLTKGLLLLLITFLVACSSADNPEKTVTAFVKALNERDWEMAKSLSTESSGQTIDLLAGFDQNVPENTNVFSFDIIKEKTTIEGDSATVTGIDQNNLEMTYDLVLVDGKWKIDVGMEKLFGGTSSIDEAIKIIDSQLRSIQVAND